MGGKSLDSSLQEGASHIYTLRLDYREFLSCINIYIYIYIYCDHYY